MQELVGPDSLSQPKCTINVSRVSLIRTVPDGGFGEAVIDVRTWERNYAGGGSELAVEEIDIAGDLTGRVYGGPYDNTTVYLNNINVRPPMHQTRVGTIRAGGVIGRGTSRPRDPAEIGGANVEIGKDGFAFLVEATTIDSISGSTVNIYADTTIDQSTSLDRRITQLQTTGTRSSSSEQENIAGIHGTIKADLIAPIENLPARISCDGDLSANLLLGTRSTTAIGAVRKNGDNTPVIRIGRSFRSGKVIQANANGLNGQIVFNNQNDTGGWAGSVIVGTTTLAPDVAGAYPTASSALGDSTNGFGAVGLVPFRFYAADCSPLSVSPTTGTPNAILDSDLRGTRTVGTPQRLKLAFYGPVKSSNSGRAPFDIKLAIPGSNNSQFFDVTGRFNVTVRGLNSNNVAGRVVEVSGFESGFYAARTYKIVQNSTSGGAAGSRLRSDTPGGEEVPPFEYWFQVKKDCNNDGVPDLDQLTAIDPATSLMYDQNENGVLDVCEPLIPCTADFNGDALVEDSDFVTFVYAYNMLECSDPAMPSDCPADLDDNEVVDDADFVLFAAQYDQLLCP